MSANLYLCNELGELLPEFFDSDHWAGDNQFAREDLPKDYRWTTDQEIIWRPRELEAWRKLADSLPNSHRFHEILDIVEERSSVWIYVSW